MKQSQTSAFLVLETLQTNQHYNKFSDVPTEEIVPLLAHLTLTVARTWGGGSHRAWAAAHRGCEEVKLSRFFSFLTKGPLCSNTQQRYKSLHLKIRVYEAYPASPHLP